MSASTAMLGAMPAPQAITHDIANPIRDQLVCDCQAMVQHALSRGQELPPAVIDGLALVSALPSPGDLAPLAELHARLSRIVAPATPAGLRMIQDDLREHVKLHILGPLPSLRYLMAAACFFSASFICLALFPEINHAALQSDLYEMSGYALLIPLLFLLSAAGLGATFGALFEAYQYVAEGRFDARLDSVYWTRIGLGLVAGLLLAEMIPGNATPGNDLQRPLIALLGGFSAAVVHRILQRFVSAIEGVFTPPATGANVAATPSAYPSRIVEESRFERMMPTAAMLAPVATIAPPVIVDAQTVLPVAAALPSMPLERLLATIGQDLAEEPFKRWVALMLHVPLGAGAIPPAAVTADVVSTVLQRRPKLLDALGGAPAAADALLKAIAAGDNPIDLRNRLARYAPGDAADSAIADLQTVLLEVVVEQDLAPVMPAGSEASATLAAAAALSLDPASSSRLDGLMMAVVQARRTGWSVDQVLQQAATAAVPADLQSS